MTEALAAAQPWHASFPSPASRPQRISVGELAQLIELHGPISDQVLVVDVRRTDFDVGFIRGAINLPAQSFYQTLPSILSLFGGYSRLVFHCQSSNGRGPRAAGWAADAMAASIAPQSWPQVLVLDGGIKAWLAEYGSNSTLTVPLDQQVHE